MPQLSIKPGGDGRAYDRVAFLPRDKPSVARLFSNGYLESSRKTLHPTLEFLKVRPLVIFRNFKGSGYPSTRFSSTPTP